MAKQGNGSSATEVVRRGRRAASVLTEESHPQSPVGPRRGRPMMMGNKAQVTIMPVETDVLYLDLVGDQPLIVHKFGAKHKDQIRRKQMKEATQAKKAKDPFDDFIESLHIIPGSSIPKKLLAKRLPIWGTWPFLKETFGFPAIGFKKAAVNAGKFANMPSTILRGAMHVLGDMIPITYKVLRLREDTVRIGPVGRKVADLRYRGEFQNWSVRLPIRYNKRVISAEQIANIFENAGFSIGVGEHRPEKDGENGTFFVKR